MPIGPGARLGPYEIVGLLGEGGMGTVWRARHTALKRDDAIKVLPDSFTSDPERVARFRREAELLASLNHAHIAALYGLEQGDGQQALVLELVEGPTLAERIAEGPIPGPEALGIARQVAEALEAAHEQGIIHRDLKPANIKVKDDGTVKVLDFGLAKMLAPGMLSDSMAPIATLANSPTITSPLTMGGVILGTAAYMSPEQARGKRVDRRADIWAFGCVLYEMLTGQRTFQAEEVTDTLVAVLSREPDWQALPSSMPPAVRDLLERCLRKDPRRRLPDIGVARIELEETGNEPPAVVQSVAASNRWVGNAGWALALVLLLTSMGLALQRWRQPAADAPMIRFDLATQQARDPQLSPDGRKLAYVAALDGNPAIWVHRFDVGAAEPIPSTVGSGPIRVFWSPDSENLGFISDGRIKRVSLAGGPSQVVSTLPAPSASANVNLRLPTSYYATWNQHGVILFSAPSDGVLLMVPAAGGEVVPATELDAARKERYHQFPSFLPDGQHYLFYAVATPATGGEGNASFIGTLGSRERRPLPGISSQVKYSSSGHLLFVRDGALMAQSFDAGRLEQTGDAFVVADAVGESASSGLFSASSTGALAYSSTRQQSRQFAWFDRTGKQVSTVGPMGDYQQPTLAPNGRFVAFQRGGASTDIWVMDLERGVTSPLTSHPGRETSPVWAPDSKTVAFDSVRGNQRQVFTRAFGTIGEDQLLLKASVRNLSDWSRDGKYLAYEDGTNIWAIALPVSAAATPQRISEDSPFAKNNPKISPDGRWIAYDSTESRGRADVIIQSFPNIGVKRQVSTAGGTQPNWSHDGRELFYLAPDSTLMAVSIKTNGSDPELGVPAALFQPRFDVLPVRGYSVSADGRFLFCVSPSQSLVVTVIFNWVGRVK